MDQFSNQANHVGRIKAGNAHMCDNNPQKFQRFPDVCTEHDQIYEQAFG